ncbi:MAG: hypothetical protein MJ097_07905, partial [Dorea sp.]|nr:hypothetical protein [Dorea sp.]
MTDDARSGTRSFGFRFNSAAAEDTDGNLDITRYAEVSLVGGKTYTFSGYLKNIRENAFSEDSEVYLGFGTSGASSLLKKGVTLQSATYDQIENGWQRMEVSYTPENSGTYCVMACVSKVSGTSYFDD